VKAVEAIEIEKQSTAKDAKLLLILQQSPELQRIVAAWPSVPKTIERIFEMQAEAPVDRQQRWEWLWGLVDVDKGLWLRLALLADNRFNRELLERAITLKLVFPDGSLQSWVDRFVSFVAVGVFARGKKGKGKGKGDLPEVNEG
jgi:hypothetical protein